MPSVSDEVKLMVANEMAAMREQMKKFFEDNQSTKGNVNKTGIDNNKNSPTPSRNLIKSPSNNSLYTPLVRRKKPEEENDELFGDMSQQLDSLILDKSSRVDDSVSKRDDNKRKSSSGDFWANRAKRSSETAILEAERFKAKVNQPEGRQDTVLPGCEQSINGKSD